MKNNRSITFKTDIICMYIASPSGNYAKLNCWLQKYKSKEKKTLSGRSNNSQVVQACICSCKFTYHLLKYANQNIYFIVDVVVWKYDKEKQINIISCLSTTRVCKTRFSAKRNINLNIHYSKCRVSQRFFFFVS